MTAPTREQKRQLIETVRDMAECDWPCYEAEFAAILADYAPLSDERRAELEWRRGHLAHIVGKIDNLSLTCDSPSLVDQRNKVRAWLAEIDAELEGGDG